MRQERLPHYEADATEPIAVNGRLEEYSSLRVVGLFAGIGGVEAGLRNAGHHSTLLCEFDHAATEVLRTRFPSVETARDIRDLTHVPNADLIAAGFPCQDLSIAGPRGGISGERSSLVQHVFRLLDAAAAPPRLLLLENVPFILQLQQGEGMRFLIAELERRGYSWAYRIVDSRAFGLPHRRRRLLLLASMNCDAAGPLLGTDSNGPAVAAFDEEASCGFYWTEGHRGIAWSVDCVPPIKVGSGLGIPSAPAIWNPKDGSVVHLHIHDLERLQGFEPGWTAPAENVSSRTIRWKLVGNSVSVPLTAWLGKRLVERTQYDRRRDWPLSDTAPWPNAAWGGKGRRYESSVSMWPVAEQLYPLREFLRYEGEPLSPRAAAGLLNRLSRYGANVPERFLKDLRKLAAQFTAPESVLVEQPTSSLFDENGEAIDDLEHTANSVISTRR
jgi:DNA (cytosine-5)-methyltransferase 1